MILEKVYQKDGQWAEHIIEGYDSFAALVSDKYIDYDNTAAEEFQKEYFFFDEASETFARNEKPLTEEDAAYWWKKLNGGENELLEVVVPRASKKFSLLPDLQWERGNGAQADRFAIEERFETKEAAEKFFIEEIVEEFEKFDDLGAAIDAAREREGADVLTYTLMEWTEDCSEGTSVKSEVIDSAFFVVVK